MAELRRVIGSWRERPGLWAALALVCALHALGAAAPLVANDAPLWMGTPAGWRWPALEQLEGGERFVLLLAPWILAAPLWAASRWRARIALGWPALALLVALLWQLLAGPHVFIPAGEWKRELGGAPALFAPIPFGQSETNPSEPWRPPTWLASSKIDEQGRYEQRAVPSSGGLELPASRVEVRAGEPARNAPLRHALGTDAQGRDLFARVVWGARNSLTVGLASALVALVLGTLLGGLAGWRGGRADVLVSRAIELVLCFPLLFAVLLVMSVGGGGSAAVWTIALVLGLSGWTGVARLLRAELLRLREAEFVLAARGLGFSELRIVIRHALPNALAPLIVATSFFAGTAMLVESAISYLGAGLVEPESSLGGLVRGGTEHAWMVIFPGLVLALAVVAWNLLGEELRDWNDPRLRGGGA
ncbi:MAG: ABC transporter permease [Planctomycetes bacterium]|nr:ABC transporter permease [Planctomycetota bacterium]